MVCDNQVLFTQRQNQPGSPRGWEINGVYIVYDSPSSNFTFVVNKGRRSPASAWFVCKEQRESGSESGLPQEQWTASTLMIPLPRTFPPTPHSAVRRATVWSGRHELCIAESLKIRPTTNRYETERVKGSSFGFVLYSLRFEQFYSSECEKTAAYVTVTFPPICTLSVSIEVPICTTPRKPFCKTFTRDLQGLSFVV